MSMDINIDAAEAVWASHYTACPFYSLFSSKKHI